MDKKSKKIGWEYRVIKRKVERKTMHGVYEYYFGQGEIILGNPRVNEHSLRELRSTLLKMLEALDKPELKHSDILKKNLKIKRKNG